MEQEIERILRDTIGALRGAKALGLRLVPKAHIERIKSIEKEIRQLRGRKKMAHASVECADLTQLEQMVRSCNLCPLSKTRKNPVFGEGARNPILMLIGEAPGREEDIKARPFVGRSGELLTKMLRAINLERSEVFITSVVKCRPPKNRTPKKEEIETCLPYLLRQIELLDPKLILCLGGTAAKALLDTESPLSKLRGHFHDYQGRRLLVTYHPAYLLRFGGSRLLDLKRQAWHDLQLIQQEYEKIKKGKEN